MVRLRSEKRYNANRCRCRTQRRCGNPGGVARRKGAHSSTKRSTRNGDNAREPPVSVYEQHRRLAFEERAEMHDYLMEGFDRVFKGRCLPPIAEVGGKNRGGE